MQQPLYLEQRDGTPLSELYQRHAPAILHHLQLHLPAREDAEDLLVDTFLAAFENKNFQELAENRQRLWLWRVARNKVVDYYRASSRRQMVKLDEVADEIFYDADLEPEQLAERSEEYVSLHQHVHELTPLQQQILRLRFVNGLRCNEIAQRVGKSEGAVRMLFSRTLNALRSIYTRK